MKKKIISLVLVFAMALALGIGGTVAWLTAQTDPLTNTFTIGDINITLEETKSDFKMVPGSTIEKDPKVTVTGGSEDCWLFVKIDESNVLDDYISYAVAAGWTELEAGIYYREVASSDADQSFSVLLNNQVTVLDKVSKSDMEALKKENAIQPTLTFTAYAVQKDNIDDVATAWSKITNPDA